MKNETRNLLTDYSLALDFNDVLSEYPRPQLKRNSYFNLNGLWDYQISKEKIINNTFDGKILVPFAIESLLSKVHKKLEIDDYLTYHKSFKLPDNFIKNRVLLNFGAVDQIAHIYLNSHFMNTHIGGYFPFSIDITDFIQSDNDLYVIVEDPTDSSYRAFGKQSLDPKNIWYTPVTGIWQSVWIESVPNNYLKSLKINPNFDTSKLTLTLDATSYNGKVEIYDSENLIQEKPIKDQIVEFTINNFKAWSPESPYLYDIKISLGEDVICSYFAFRKFSIGTSEYGKCINLNNQPYFLNGLLDQGYYSDGLYTPATDQAMIDDIQIMKNMGFNTLRKHIKIEPLRWYYHCDRIGMIVWQDIVNGGNYKFLQMSALPTLGIKKVDDTKNLKTFGRESTESQNAFLEELIETVGLLSNTPSIGLWTIFNEGWGQFNSSYFYKVLKNLDSTRIVDTTSGWFDQGSPDVASKHIYFKKVRIKPEDRPVVLSEFGGYSFKIDTHSYSINKEYGYRRYNHQEDFINDFIHLYESEIVPNIKNGLCACIYTQLSDVEEETNGILTYDRKVNKLDIERVKSVNEKLKLI